jgi:hypothetical protein
MINPGRLMIDLPKEVDIQILMKRTSMQLKNVVLFNSSTQQGILGLLQTNKTIKVLEHSTWEKLDQWVVN